ncbi:MAG: rod shape-determining protein MreD [Croceitalea sp.]|nr:rod shape-determining protein MreD [Croceitalea sp.]NNL07802.1 rod shape-determining protein MreD [Croceitalea sp.]
MLNNPILINILRFALLVIAQILIFNQLNFFGFINPLVYVLFIYWYPLRENRAFFLLISFFLGFVIDVFSDTMALHALATVTLAYSRPILMRFIFGANYELQGFTFKNATRLQRMTYLLFLIVLQQIIFFSFEILSFGHILLILKKILFTSFVTFIFCVLLSSLFAVENE